MDFRLLGPFGVYDDQGREVELGGRQQRLVLAMLLLHRNEVVSVDRLIDVVWGERAPANAVKNVQIYVSRLRKALEATSPESVVQTRPERLRPRGRAGRARRRPLRAPRGGGPASAGRRRAGAGGDVAAGGARPLARRSRSPTSRTTRSLRARSRGWTSSGSAPWRSGSRPIWLSAATTTSPPSCRLSSRSTHCASACAVSSCSRCIAPAERRTRCASTTRRAARSPRSWVSSRARACSGSSGRY